MKVFLSWSGDRSRKMAQLLREWISDVLQTVEPWVSTDDIDRGAVWFSEISDQLKETTIGIICLTPENLTEPWILFEAGAIAKGLPESRILTLLIDLQHSDVRGPLAQFNHTLPNKSDMLKLLSSINKQLGIAALHQSKLTKVFEKFWQDFEDGYKAIEAAKPSGKKKPEKDDKEVMTDILEELRRVSSRLTRLEKSEVDEKPVLTPHRQNVLTHRDFRKLAAEANTMAKQLMDVGGMSKEEVRPVLETIFESPVVFAALATISDAP